jgi:hypothetical protein
MADKRGVCERCGKEYARISTHRSRNRNLPYCGAPDHTATEGDCPKCGRHLKRLDLHLKLFPGDTVCRVAMRTPTGPSLDEVAETYPSVKWGQDEWYAILKADNAIFNAILGDMAKQGRKHPIGQEYDSKNGWKPIEPPKGE